MKRRDFLAGAGAASAAALAGCTGTDDGGCGHDSTPSPTVNGSIGTDCDAPLCAEVDGAVEVTAENPHPDVSFEELTVVWSVRRSDGSVVERRMFTFGDLPAGREEEKKRVETFTDPLPIGERRYGLKYTYSYEYRCE